MTKTETKNECLAACFGQPVALEPLITYADDSIVSKTLIDKPAGTITLFAFERGQRLSEHTAPYDAFVQVVDGQGVVTIAGKDHPVKTGEVVIMPANVPHAVRAEERFKMLLTMIRSK